MNEDAWPTPSGGSSREPLPRVEDLPLSETGFEQESVRAAFDAFYRHSAQLDAALRTLEAVDSFHRQAAALRADLRTLRTAGWTQQPWAATPAYGAGGRGPHEGISPAVWRILGEVAFLVAVSVLLGVAKVSWWVIVAVMAGAFLIVALIEWASSREPWLPSAGEPVEPHPVVEAERAEPADAGDAQGWTAFEEAQEPSDAMTMIGSPPEPEPAHGPEPAQEPEPAHEPVPVHDPEPLPEADAEPVLPVEPQPVVEAAAADSSPEPAAGEAGSAEPGPPLEAEGAEDARRPWWRRRHEGDEYPEAEPPEVPRHVRVLPAHDSEAAPIDPWERGFDGDEGPPPAPNELEETGEGGATVGDADEPEPPARRRFRRR